MQSFFIQTTVSGRYLLRSSLHSVQAPLLAGFHGYGQTAEDELQLLCAIPGAEYWHCCSIEALHPFYISRNVSGASWMTSRQREQRIEENVRYVDTVLDALNVSLSLTDTLVFHGFSQGSGMASRAALLGRHPGKGLMLLGGDFPPGLVLRESVGKVHLARGIRDRFYTKERFDGDLVRLYDAGVQVTATSFIGDHGANREYLDAAGRFLSGL
ncbi:MAG: phospholipase [Chlorobiaceae bacterium]|jgi:predicted esterase|nr:phospholipase [Chlorobiaceae bacterium]